MSRHKPQRNKSVNSHKDKEKINEVQLNNHNLFVSNCYKLAKLSIFVPLTLSLIFFCFEMKGLRIKALSLTFDQFLSLIISYLAPTLISTASFMLLQQFFLFVPAGVNEQRGWILVCGLVVFMLCYTAYLVYCDSIFEKLFICISAVGLYALLLFSLKKEDRRVDAGMFSGHA